MESSDSEEAAELTVTCPPECGPGDVIEVEFGESVVDVTIPDGVGPGDTFDIQLRLGGSSDDDDPLDSPRPSSSGESPAVSTAQSSPTPQELRQPEPQQTARRSGGHSAPPMAMSVQSMAARRAEAARLREQREEEEIADARARAKLRPVRKSAAQLADAAEQLHRRSNRADALIAAKRQQEAQGSTGRLHGGKTWNPDGESATRLLKPRERPTILNRQADFSHTLRRYEQRAQPPQQTRRQPRRQQPQLQPQPQPQHPWPLTGPDATLSWSSDEEPLFLVVPGTDCKSSTANLRKEIEIVHREREAFKTRLIDALVKLEDCRRVQQQAAVKTDQLLDVRHTPGALTRVRLPSAYNIYVTYKWIFAYKFYLQMLHMNILTSVADAGCRCNLSWRSAETAVRS